MKSSETCLDCQTYCSMSYNEGFAALPKGTALPNTIKLVVDVPNWSVSKYCSRHARLLYALWLTSVSTDGWCRTVIDFRGIGHETNIGTWERRWLSSHQCCAGMNCPAGPSEMLFILHGDCIRTSLVRFVLDVPGEVGRRGGLTGYWFFYLGPPCDKFFSVRDVAN